MHNAKKLWHRKFLMRNHQNKQREKKQHQGLFTAYISTEILSSICDLTSIVYTRAQYEQSESPIDFIHKILLGKAWHRKSKPLFCLTLVSCQQYASNRLPTQPGVANEHNSLSCVHVHAERGRTMFPHAGLHRQRSRPSRKRDDSQLATKSDR